MFLYLEIEIWNLFGMGILIFGILIGCGMRG
jgi:hypothetical protein